VTLDLSLRRRTAAKLAVAVGPGVHEGIVSAAAEQCVSVSAWMTEAARRALLVRDGLAAIAERERLNGSFTSQETTAARRRVVEELRQASSSPRQARLRRFWRGRDVVAFEPGESHQVGTMLAKSGATDVVGAHVFTASCTGAVVITSGPGDIRALAVHTRPRITA
jgi:hypothetical protein